MLLFQIPPMLPWLAMLLFRILPMLFLGAAAWIFAREILALRRSKQSETWPFTEGEIISSRVKSSYWSSGQISESAAVRYKYEVNGTTYVSRTISFGSKLYWRFSAQEVLAMYPVGGKVTVYYNPDNPKIATLEPGISVGSFVILGLIAIILLVGLSFFFTR